MIEIGSRAVRLLVAEVYADHTFKILDTGSRITNLASVSEHQSKDAREVLDLTVGACVEFQKRANRHLDKPSFVFGTEGIRGLAGEHLDYLLRGVPQLVVLTKKDEALSSFVACTGEMANRSNASDPILVIDQGGSSMECVVGRRSVDNVGIQLSKSYRLGTQLLLRLLRKNGYRIDHYTDELRKRFDRLTGISAFHCDNVVLMGSAPTKLAFLKVRASIEQRYSPELVNGAEIVDSDIDLLVSVAQTGWDAVKNIIDPKGTQINEAETVVAGIISLRILLGIVHPAHVHVSGLGTRHGLTSLLAMNDQRICKYLNRNK